LESSLQHCSQPECARRPPGRDSPRLILFADALGLIPFWAEDPKAGDEMINARAETIAEKPAFRDPPSAPFDSLREWCYRCSPRRTRGETVGKQIDLLQGTLDMLILKAVSLGPLHGYGVLLRIQQISGEQLEIQQGSLYPALYRLEHEGLISSEWGESDNKRKAKFYSLTAAGRRQLHFDTEKWSRMAVLIASILRTTPEEI